MSKPLDNYYAILELSIEADADEITQAIKFMRRRWRQQQGSPDKERARLADERMSQLEEAGTILLEPTKRAEYDAQLIGQPPAPPATEQTSTGEWSSRAKHYYDTGDMGNALIAAERGINLDQNDEQSWFIYMDAALELERFDEADFASAELVLRRPTDPEVYDRRGRALSGLGRYREAEQSYLTALRCNPSNHDYAKRATYAKLDQGRIDEALLDARQYLNEGSAESAWGLILHIGWRLNENFREEEALNLVVEFIERTNDPELLSYVAWEAVQGLCDRYEFDVAQRGIDQLLSSDPNNEDFQRAGNTITYNLLQADETVAATGWACRVHQRCPAPVRVRDALGRAVVHDVLDKLDKLSYSDLWEKEPLLASMNVLLDIADMAGPEDEDTLESIENLRDLVEEYERLYGF